MATSPEAVRAQLAVVTSTLSAEVVNAAAGVALERQAQAALAAVGLAVPGYYDAAGSLAVAWYDELRDESRPVSAYSPTIIGDPVTDWIDREAERLLRTLDGVDLEQQTQRMLDEIAALAEKEAARGFRDSMLGNTRQDADAIGWSRVAHPGGCKFCLMLAGQRRAFYRSESTAGFGAHTNCNCAARPEFEGGDHGPEATVEMYLASAKRRTPAQRTRVRKYLNENYPDAPG